MFAWVIVFDDLWNLFYGGASCDVPFSRFLMAFLVRMLVVGWEVSNCLKCDGVDLKDEIYLADS